MDFIVQMWIPIVASGAAVWFYSFFSWAMSPIHKGDFVNLTGPKNRDVMDFIARSGLKPGNYGYGLFADHKEANKPENKARWGAEPMGQFSVWARPNMGANMAFTFLFYCLVSVFVAYLGHETLGGAATFGRKFQICGTAGVLAYSFAFVPGSIWFQAGRNSIISHVFDGVMQGLITGAMFAWLWRAA